MIRIIIDDKIVDDNLLKGQKVQVEYLTTFNDGYLHKVFPDDFTPEEQSLFKQIYEKVVFESEIGRNVYKCNNTEGVITIEGFTRTGINDLDRAYFNSEDVLKLRFTRHGISNKSVDIECKYGESFTQEQLDLTNTLSISISGIGSNFEVLNYDGDISIEVIKDVYDSYIDLGDFKQGKIIFKK